MKCCIVEGCTQPCLQGRRYCDEHHKQRKREQAKARYATGKRTWYDINCLVCGKLVKATRQRQKYCIDCYRAVQKIGNASKNIHKHERGHSYNGKHRQLAEALLKRTLLYNEVVHHLNGNIKDNTSSNLIVMSRADHALLHTYLREQGVILSKGNIENLENCWKTLIVPMTTTWLETANVKVIKLWEIGQSAAEPLSNGEGSETMHETAKHECAS